MELEKEKEGKELKGKAKSIFTGLASSYEKILDRGTLLQDRKWKRWLLRSIAVAPNERVLDIGCGTLLLEESFEGTGSSVSGVDLTERMIRMGQAKGLSCVKALVLADAESLPFRDDCFDVVVSCYVAKYCATGRFASEVARVARPLGRIAIYDFSRPSGPLLPALALYVYGGLRMVGFLLALRGSESALTFQELPSIVRRSDWDDHLSESLSRNGVEIKEQKVFAGGIVTGVSGSKAKAG